MGALAVPPVLLRPTRVARRAAPTHLGHQGLPAGITDAATTGPTTATVARTAMGRPSPATATVTAAAASVAFLARGSCRRTVATMMTIKPVPCASSPYV